MVKHFAQATDGGVGMVRASRESRSSFAYAKDRVVTSTDTSVPPGSITREFDDDTDNG